MEISAYTNSAGVSQAATARPVNASGRQANNAQPAASEDTVNISDEGRQKAQKMGRSDDSQKQGDEAQAFAVDKDSVVTDLQDTQSNIKKVTSEIDDLKRAAATDDTKAEELKQKKVKLDDLQDQQDKMESKLSS